MERRIQEWEKSARGEGIQPMRKKRLSCGVKARALNNGKAIEAEAAYHQCA